MSWPLSLNIISHNIVLHSYLPKVYISIVYTTTYVSLMPSINFRNSHNTGVDSLVSMTTKRNEHLVGQKMTKHVLNLIS